MIERDQLRIRIGRQTELLSLARSSVYYKAKGSDKTVSDERLKQEILAVYDQVPFYGYRKITKAVRDKLGMPVNKKRVQRLMFELGIRVLTIT